MSRVKKMIEMARAHVEAGGMNSAGAYYRMVLADTSPPKNGFDRVAHGEACWWYAQKSLAEGRIGTATDWYRRALQADPRSVHYRIEYIRTALMPMNLMKNARIEAEMCTKLEPNNPDAWRILGIVEHALGNAEASMIAHTRQMEIAPGPLANMDRAMTALDTADYETVQELIADTLDTDQHANALNLSAMVAFRQGDYETSIRLYDQAIKAGCNDPKLAEWNKSLALHSIGRYLEGWAAHEARGHQKTDAAMRLIMNRFNVPMWKNEPAPAHIHVHQEMGFGDVIAMVRYVKLLLDLDYEITVEVNDNLVSLVRRSFPQAEVIPRAIDYPGSLGIKPFDYHIPMLSFPYVFKTDINTVPWFGPYLIPDPEKVNKYKKYKGCIGLCWSSGIRNEGMWLNEYGKRKSCGWNNMRWLLPPITRMGQTNESFVSLQVGPEAVDCGTDIVSPLPKNPTWDDTAALIANLDMVITVDTSVAHLAGALGKPVWVLMHTQGSWHWMTKRLDSPWYPSACLFRQEKPHEWQDVIFQVANKLENQMEEAV